MLGMSDLDLARRLLAGDETGFDAFFGGYFPKLYRFALARLGDEGAAEDVAQATLIKAVHKLHTYRGEAAMFSWLCTFCRHEISAYYALRERRVPELPLVEDAPDVKAALESLSAMSTSGPDEQYRRREVARLVQVTLDTLPEPYGDALEWKYIQGWSVDEIATKLRIGPKAAESLLTRARLAFRDAFTGLHQDIEVWGR